MNEPVSASAASGILKPMAPTAESRSEPARYVEIRRARRRDALAVQAVLLEAAEWLRERGDPLWSPDAFELEELGRDVAAGHYVVAWSGEQAVGVLRVTEEDPLFWPDANPEEALYLHRLAVRRAHAGGLVSTALLTWAGQRARRLGRRYLRLDCDANRPRLRALYERLGYVFDSERLVGSFHAARYQKLVPVSQPDVDGALETDDEPAS